MKSNTRKKATKPATAAKSKTRRRAKPDAADLIQTAARLGLKLYAVEGLTNFRQRAREAIKRMEENGHSMKDNTAEDHILTCQFIRESGDVDPEIVFAWIDSLVHDIALDDAELKRLYDASEARHREAGFGEDDEWPEDKRPADVQALFDAYWELYYQLKVAILRHHGEDEIADLLENDSDAYDVRLETCKALAEKFHSDHVIKGTTGSSEVVKKD